MRSTIALSCFTCSTLAVWATRRPAHSSKMARTSKMSSASSTLIWRTNTPRFFSWRTRPDSSRARNASRTGPRDTPSRSASATSLSFAPAPSSPARIMRSNSFCTSIGSELDWSSAMAAGSGVSGDGLETIFGVPFIGVADLPTPLGRLAAPDARLNVVDARHEVGDGVDDVMRAALLHSAIGAAALERLLIFRKRLPRLERQSDLIAADGETHRPHPGVEALFDTGNGVVDFHAGLHSGDFEVNGVLHAHVRVGPPCRHIRGAHGGIGLVALPLRVLAIDLHHFGQVAGGRSDLDAAPAQFRHHLQRARNERRIFGEARELQRHERGEHGIHVGLARRTAVHLLPAAMHRVQLEDLLNVHPFVS